MALAATHIYMDDPSLACPSRETIRLYDGAIAALHDAVKAIAADDIEARCCAVQKATEIVTTLYLNIEVKRQGEIAESLSRIYSHILGLLLRVNLYNDARIAARAVDLLEPLRESWTDLDAVTLACEWPGVLAAPEIANRVDVA